MNLFPWTNAGDFLLNRPVANKRGRHVDNARRWSSRHVSLPRKTSSHGRENRVDSVVEAEKKPRHFNSCDSHRATFADLIQKQRNNRAARGKNIPITDA